MKSQQPKEGGYLENFYIVNPSDVILVGHLGIS